MVIVESVDKLNNFWLIKIFDDNERKIKKKKILIANMSETPRNYIYA